MRLEAWFFFKLKPKKSRSIFPTSVHLKQCSVGRMARVTRVRENTYGVSMNVLIKQIKSQLQTHGKPFITDLIIFISWKTPTATNLVINCYVQLKCTVIYCYNPTQLGVTLCIYNIFNVSLKIKHFKASAVL